MVEVMEMGKTRNCSISLLMSLKLDSSAEVDLGNRIWEDMWVHCMAWPFLTRNIPMGGLDL